MRYIKSISLLGMLPLPGQPPSGAGGVSQMSLRVNFVWTLVGNGVYAGCQFGAIALLAKVGTPELVGQYTMGMAVTAPLVLFCNLALRQVQVTDSEREYDFSDYLSLRLVTTGIAWLAVVAIVVLVGYDFPKACVVVLVGVAKAFESISDVFYGRLQHWERMDRVAISMMMRGPLSLFGLGVTYYFTGSLVWATAAMALSWGIVLVGYDMLVAPAGLDLPDSTRCQLVVRRSLRLTLPKLRWNWPKLGRLARLALPLGIATTMVSLNANIPRYFVESQIGEGAQGVFSAMVQLTIVGSLVVNALGQSASPRLARCYAQRNRRYFTSLLLRLTGVGAILGLAGVVVAAVGGRSILAILYQPQYAAQADVFLWLTAAAGVAYVASFLGYGVTATRQFKSILVVFSCCIGVLIMLCLVLVSRHGILGAAWAVLGTNCFQVVAVVACVAYAVHSLGINRPCVSHPPPVE